MGQNNLKTLTKHIKIKTKQNKKHYDKLKNRHKKKTNKKGE